MIEVDISLGNGWSSKNALQSTIIDKSNDGRKTIESAQSMHYWTDEDVNRTATPPLIRVTLSQECAIDSIIITSNAKFIEFYINSGYISTLKGYNSPEEKYLFECSYDQRYSNVKVIEFKFLSLKTNNKELNVTAICIDVSPKRANDVAQTTTAIPADLVFNFKKFDTEISNKLDNKIGNSAALLASMLQSSSKTPLNIDTSSTTTTKMNIIDNNYTTIIDKMIDMKLQPVVEQLNRIEQMQLEILKKINVINV